MLRSRFFLISSTVVFAFAAFVTAAEARSYNSFYVDYQFEDEVHPYDQPDRRPGNKRASYRSRFNFRTDPYFQRTTTHALHPYFRNHYDDILTVKDASRDAEYFRQAYINSYPYIQLPSATDCAEYSFYKRHNRLPPKDFTCLRP